MSTTDTNLLRTRHISFPDIDEVLGPRQQRFFGEGFKRARHDLSALEVRGIPGIGGEMVAGHVSTQATVEYPADWSRKGGHDQLPHLSTIDVLVISAQLAEIYLADVAGLSRRQRRKAVIRRIKIRAGSSPVEDELVSFSASADADTSPAGDGQAVTTVRCTVAKLRATLEINHPSGQPRALSAHYDSPVDLLGPAELRVFGGGFKRCRQLVHDVSADIAEASVAADVEFARETPGAGAEGLDAIHADAASPIDAFVVALQLGQLLLYRMDNVPRAHSNTLWMRQTVLECDPDRGPVDSARAEVLLDRLALLPTGRGEVWRTADIVGELAGVQVRCAVAHRIA